MTEFVFFIVQLRYGMMHSTAEASQVLAFFSLFSSKQLIYGTNIHVMGMKRTCAIALPFELCLHKLKEPKENDKRELFYVMKDPDKYTNRKYLLNVSHLVL